MQTVEGAKKAVKTILKKNPNHFVEVGRLGGLKKVPKGFAMNKELASRMGRLGGAKSKRTKPEKVNIGGYNASYEDL